MEPNVLRTDGFQNFVMGSAESVRVIHGSGLGRWEHIWIARMFLMFGDQQVNGLLWEGQSANRISRFRRTDHQFTADSIYLLCDGECPVFDVQVRPLEGQQFPSPQAGGQLQIEGREKPTALRFCEVHPDFLLRQDLHFFLFKLRQFAALGRVGENESLRHRLLQAVVQQCVNTPHHSGTEADIFQWREVFALNSSGFLEIVVKPLDLNGGQFIQRDAANSGDDVFFDVVGVVGFGVGADARFSIDLVPRFHPRTDCVSPGFGYIQLLTFADRGLEFLLHLGLRLAQHVLDDALSGFLIIARGVAALPASVLSFSDVPFPICSSFWHGIDLLCNGKPYRKRQRKAIEKPNCYQKVIICA